MVYSQYIQEQNNLNPFGGYGKVEHLQRHRLFSLHIVFHLTKTI